MDTGFTLFLDFDGVMITKFSSLDSDVDALAFDPVCIENLKYIIEQVKTKHEKITIIIISNWRLELNQLTINDLLLNRYGLSEYLTASNIAYLEQKGSKAQNILQIINANKLTTDRCLVLDDEYLGEELAPYQIQTRSEDGIRDLESLEQLLLNR